MAFSPTILVVPKHLIPFQGFPLLFRQVRRVHSAKDISTKGTAFLAIFKSFVLLDIYFLMLCHKARKVGTQTCLLLFPKCLISCFCS